MTNADFPPHDKMAQDLYNEITKAGLTLKKVAEMSERFRGLEERLLDLVGELNAPAILAYALEVFSPEYRKQIKGSSSRKRAVRTLIELAK